MYYLTKFDENSICKLMQIYDIINYSISICPFESGKCGKEAKKLQKFVYLENQKSFLDEINSINNIVFEHLTFDEKIKN